MTGNGGTPLLAVRGLHREFGGITAVSSVDCDVREGQIKGLIGPNGAGKTTFFNLLTGMIPPTRGTIRFRGEEITRCASHQVARRGIARTFQTMRLFGHMTALENVLVGCHTVGRSGFFRNLVHTPGMLAEEKRLRARALEALRELDLHGKENHPLSALTFFEQRRLEMARALAAKPSLFLLDEPAAGLNIRETEEMGRIIRRINASGTTIMLVEHDMSLVMDVSHEILVLDQGARIAEGSPEEVQRDERVIAVYLGTENG